MVQTNRQDIEKLLADGNYIQIKPQGYSMYPVLVPGRDEVVVASVQTAACLKRGDVVLYRRFFSDGTKDILVLHRIWKVKDRGIYLVGDNQKEIEGPLKQEQILGIATEIIRKGKHISVKNPIYKLLTGFWLVLRPMRPFISKVVAKIKGYFRK